VQHINTNQQLHMFVAIHNNNITASAIFQYYGDISANDVIIYDYCLYIQKVSMDLYESRKCEYKSEKLHERQKI